MVQDAQGGLYKLELEGGQARPILGYHAGAIYGLDTSPVSHSAVTCGQAHPPAPRPCPAPTSPPPPSRPAAPSAHRRPSLRAVSVPQDGSVRLWDYVGKSLLFSRRFGAAATCCVWADRTLDSEARTIAVGFADGVPAG